MQQTDKSHDLIIEETLRMLTLAAHRFGAVNEVMGKTLKQIFGAGQENGVGELSLGEIHFLAAVADDAPINGTLLAQKLGLTKGGISKMATRLLARGMIATERCGENKKSQYYILKDRGREICAIHKTLHKIARERIATLISTYSDEDLSLFVSMLDTITGSVEKSSADFFAHAKQYLDDYGIALGPDAP
jgi:DNA-binding MarR family transcriptional regulator